MESGKYQIKKSDYVTKYPYLDASAFREIALPTIDLAPWHTEDVRRTGFEDGYIGPHILIPQGVERSIGRVRAAYSEQSLVFRASIQAIAFPEAEERTAKVLTAVLNSSLAAWVYFHDTANLGADRAKVHQGELLKLPFDIPEKMPDPVRATTAAEKIIKLIDREISNANELLTIQESPLDEIDRLIFEYYALDAKEVALIEDTFRYIIPAMQPRRGAGLQKIWANSRVEHRSAYASMLCAALEPSFRQSVSASLAAKSNDIAVLKLTINADTSEYCEDVSLELGQFLQSIEESMRFINGQYSNGLPAAMMLGYVMNARTDRARRGVKRAMAFRSAAIRLQSDRDAPIEHGRPLRFHTTHLCVPGHTIEVAHTFLAWP